MKKSKIKARCIYQKRIVAVVVFACVLSFCSGCTVGGSPVPSFDEQIASIDDSLLNSIGVLPLHTYYQYELVNENKSADNYTSTIRFYCTEGMFLVDGELKLSYAFDREWGEWRFENATFDHEKQPSYFQCDIEGMGSL